MQGNSLFSHNYFSVVCCIKKVNILLNFLSSSGSTQSCERILCYLKRARILCFFQPIVFFLAGCVPVPPIGGGERAGRGTQVRRTLHHSQREGRRTGRSERPRRRHAHSEALVAKGRRSRQFRWAAQSLELCRTRAKLKKKKHKK